MKKTTWIGLCIAIALWSFIAGFELERKWNNPNERLRESLKQCNKDFLQMSMQRDQFKAAAEKGYKTILRHMEKMEMFFGERLDPKEKGGAL